MPKPNRPVPPEILDWRDEFLKEDRRYHWFGPWLVIVFFLAILVLICILYRISYIPPISINC